MVDIPACYRKFPLSSQFKKADRLGFLGYFPLYLLESESPPCILSGDLMWPIPLCYVYEDTSWPSLRAGRSGNWIPVEARFSAHVQTCPAAQLATFKGPIHSKLNCAVQLCKKLHVKTELNVLWYSTGFPTSLSVLCGFFLYTLWFVHFWVEQSVPM